MKVRESGIHSLFGGIKLFFFYLVLPDLNYLLTTNSVLICLHIKRTFFSNDVSLSYCFYFPIHAASFFYPYFVSHEHQPLVQVSGAQQHQQTLFYCPVPPFCDTRFHHSTSRLPTRKLTSFHHNLNNYLFCLQFPLYFYFFVYFFHVIIPKLVKRLRLTDRKTVLSFSLPVLPDK